MSQVVEPHLSAGQRRRSSSWKCFVNHEPLTASPSSVTKTSESSQRHDGPFSVLTLEMDSEPLDDEAGQGDRRRGGGGLRLRSTARRPDPDT